MSLNQNQVKQIPVKGMVDLDIQGGTVSVQIDISESGTLVPGQAVTIYDRGGGIMKVIAATADTVDIFGVINFNQRKTSYVAGDKCEISVLCGGNCIFMEASAAVARGAEVMIVVSGSKVALATTNKRIIGRAIDKASTNGDLSRVLMLAHGGLAA